MVSQLMVSLTVVQWKQLLGMTKVLRETSVD